MINYKLALEPTDVARLKFPILRQLTQAHPETVLLARHVRNETLQQQTQSLHRQTDSHTLTHTHTNTNTENCERETGKIMPDMMLYDVIYDAAGCYIYETICGVGLWESPDLDGELSR